MNSEEVCEIKKSWEIPMKNPTDSGAAILTQFFTKYPSNITKFPFKDIPVNELNDSPRFRAHAVRIIRIFDESISSLGDDGCESKLEKIWSNLATTHFKRQIKKEAYNELREVILEVLTAVCNLNERQSAAWIKLVDHVYDILFKTLDELSTDLE